MLTYQPETIYHKRRLPHMYRNNHPVFITWRLKFDLPSYIELHLKEMKTDFENMHKKHSKEDYLSHSYSYHKKAFDWLDTELGTASKLPAILHKQEIADIISESLFKHKDETYLLHTYCIMPNHVHVLITPLCNTLNYVNTLSNITKLWKGSSSRLINLLLKRSGSLWIPESYDHLVRNELEFSRIVQYILLNPVKANLVSKWTDWRSSWVDETLLDIMS